jgi:hypothetical protein
MLAPVPGHLDRKRRYANQDQYCGKNNHRGSEHGVAVYYGAGNDQDQPGAPACYGCRVSGHRSAEYPFWWLVYRLLTWPDSPE